ncbi:MAG: pilus assembly protein PilM [Candidatus Omnitrophota bacterium]
MTFSKLNESILSVEIGFAHVRIIHGDTEVSAVLPERSVVDGVITDIEGVAGVIKNLLKKNKIKAKNAVTAVSGKGLVFRLMEVPFMTPEAIKELIKDEASKYIAFSGSDLLTDFWPVEEFEGEEGRRLKILSVVVKREIVHSYIETIKRAGLKIQSIDVGALNLARSLLFGEPLYEEATILVLTEHDSGVIFIFHDKKLYYLHKIDSIQELDAGLEAVRFYCGNEFGEETGIKEIFSSGYEDISVAKGLILMEAKETDFNIKVNLLPIEELKIALFKRQSFQFLRVLTAVIAVIVFCFFVLRFQTWNAYRNIGHIQNILQKPTPLLEVLLSIEKKIKVYELEKKSQDDIFFTAQKQDWTGILSEIKRSIPKNLYLLGINTNEHGIVTFRGMALDQNAVFDFVRSLKASVFFDNVKLAESKDEIKDGKVYTYFAIKCGIKSQNIQDE